METTNMTTEENRKDEWKSYIKMWWWQQNYEILANYSIRQALDNDSIGIY